MEIGLSTNGMKPITEEHFRAMKAAGITKVEISLTTEASDAFDPAPAMEIAKKTGVELWSFHLPFAPFEEIDISSPDETLRLKSVEHMSRLILKNGSAGIPHFILHCSGETIVVEERRAHMEQAVKSLKTLADVAASVNAQILIEDLPRTCLGRSSWDILQLLKADDRLGVCFDTNHLLGEEIVDFVKKVGKKIVSTHISDYDAWNERHWLPGEGCIDWQALYNALLEVGYEGPWLYEVAYAPEWCIVRDRDLTPEDFVRNAREVFENKPLTVLGKPIEPMTFWRA